MRAIRVTFLHFFLFAAILLHPVETYGQWISIDSIWAGGAFADTSEYIPSFYDGALEYNLMIASSKGYVTEIDRLIAKGAEINSETNEGASPLVFAVMNNRLDAVLRLLEYDPDIDRVTSNQETPLLIAVKNRNFDISEALIRAGANMDWPDRHGATALHHASINGYTDIIDLLLYYNAATEIKSVEGATPLLASIWAGYIDVADLLIQNGANMETRNNEGFTPFLMASFYGDTLIMDLLFKKGVDIYATNNSNHNALTLSILAGQNNTTLYLLRIGNKWVNPGSDAINPYSVAAKYSRKDMINILRNNNIPGYLERKIDQAALTVSSRFFTGDYYSGLSLAFKEPYINGGFIAGCDMKLWYTRVLIQQNDYLFYQYFNKRAVAYTGIFKDFDLTDLPYRLNYSLSTSLLAGYSFGNSFKGTLTTPENKFMIIPSISLKMIKMNYSASVGIEYMKTGFYHNGPLWVRVGLTYNHFFDNVRTNVKTLKWY